MADDWKEIVKVAKSVMLDGLKGELSDSAVAIKEATELELDKIVASAEREAKALAKALIDGDEAEAKTARRVLDHLKDQAFATAGMAAYALQVEAEKRVKARIGAVVDFVKGLAAAKLGL